MISPQGYAGINSYLYTWERREKREKSHKTGDHLVILAKKKFNFGRLVRSLKTTLESW